MDEGDWKCIQCARYYYREPAIPTRELRFLQPPAETDGSVSEEAFAHEPFVIEVHSSDPIYLGEAHGRKRKLAYRPRSARNVNSLIQMKSSGEARWWSRNREIIEHLDKGLSVREVSLLTDRGQRHVRTVRERLTDLRSVARENEEIARAI